MIPHEKINVCETSMSGSTSFSIQANAKMFRILSSGLYSNKEKAIIREISCNAYDANIDAGHLNPIVVHLPNTLEPFFSVKDTGPGLTKDQMTNVYTQYGNSTKTDRNDQIGALGLGSKSPFSYCSSFTVISIVDGVKDTYSCYLDENGAPQLQPFGTDETDEPNGVEVTFPVKQEDFKTFKTEAEKVFRAFEIKPDVVGNTEYSVEDYNIIATSKTDKDWDIITPIRKNYRTENIRVAAQGNIEYPINTDIIYDKLSKDAKKFTNLDYRLYFDIGDLDIAASREELGYDELTINNIVNKFEKMVSELGDVNQENINNCDSLYEARLLVNDIKNSSNVYNYITFNYKGTVIDAINIPIEYNVIKYSRNYNGTIKREASDKYSKTLYLKANKTNIFVFNDDNKKTTNITKARSLVTNENSVIYISDTRALDLIGNPKYINASDIEKIKKATSGVPTTGRHFKRYYHSERNDQQWGLYNEASNYGLDVTKEFYYTVMEGRTSKVNIHTMVELAREFDIIDDDTQIYGVSEAHMRTKKFKNYNAINFVEVIKAKIINSPKLKEYMGYANKVTFDNKFSYLDTVVSTIIKNREIDTGIFSEISDMLELYADIDITNYIINKVKNFAYQNDIDANSVDNVTALFDGIEKKYPLLTNMRWGTQRTDVVSYIEAMDLMEQTKKLQVNANQTTIAEIREEA